MPYIKQEDRDQIGVGPEGAAPGFYLDDPSTPGELNYILTSFIFDYFKNNGGNYQAINDVIGALEGAKLEFYRRVAAPYEDTKIIQNGDVYE